MTRETDSRDRPRRDGERLAKGARSRRPRIARMREVSVEWRDGQIEKVTESTTRRLGARALRGRSFRPGVDLAT